MLTLEAEGSLFWQTGFSRDGNLLGSSNMNSGILHVWRAPTWQEIEGLEKAEGAR